MSHLKTDNYAELSRVLGHKSRQHLDNCLKRGNIPTNRIINYAIKEGISLAWLFGQPTFLNDFPIRKKYGTSVIATKEHIELQKDVNKTYRKLIDVEHESREN